MSEIGVGMRVVAGVSLFLTFLSTVALAGIQTGNGGIGWYTDYEDAQAEARATGKPLLIEFRCVP